VGDGLKLLRLVGILAGVLLAVIGLRFLLWPLSAQKTFGLGRGDVGTDLHSIIGLRDLWLAGLALAFAWTKAWRALSLWFGLAALVCFADAVIVAAALGRSEYIAFHAGCGIASAIVAARLWRRE
jgi:hypothetical protein